MVKVVRIPVMLALPLAIAACNGGSGGGTAPVVPNTTPNPLVSLREVLPTTGQLEGTDGQYEASTIQGAVVTPSSTTTTGGSTGLLGGLLALLLGSPTTTTTTTARLDYPFDFDEAAMARTAEPEGIEVTLTGNRAGGGTAKELTATFKDWTAVDTILPGLRHSLSETATLTGFTAAEYTSLGDVKVTILDATATTDLSYVAFGYWVAEDFDPADATKYQFMAAGGSSFSTEGSPDLTTIASLPATATYIGKTVGSAAVNSGIDGISIVAGNFLVRADFGTGLVNARAYNLMVYDSAGNSAPLGSVTFSRAAIDMGNATFSGGTAKTFFDPATTTGTTPNGQTALEGGFFGPAANETAGTWYVSGDNMIPDTTGTPPVVEISGSFGAAQ
ncbi:transferrin-binding protein-like solute binding protein [Zavarzinia compransoris]|uniref:transferrin-binding protein-like solute binding protein n=1 Tax=Zavarzinia marina TaxID=2911065 RepID=UPI001F423BB3|nr:transferrin-binding protein-like solute binding protein [Zavarzinia marina]MCF4164072.1 transferrin-binding protein-like solute binding protein [Zavarzinia marina]